MPDPFSLLSDLPAFDFHDNNALATSFFVKVLIRDLVWPEDVSDFSETPVVEGFKFAHVRFYDAPALRTVAVELSYLSLNVLLNRSVYGLC